MQFSMIGMWQEMGLLARSVVFILMGMSLLSLATAVEKWLFLSRAARESAPFLRVWRERVALQGYVAAASIAEKYSHCVTAQIVTIRTRILNGVANASQLSEVYDRAVRREILTTGSTACRGLGLLATVGSTAPFVGLFGTVVGIVNAFQKMAVSRQGGLGVVSAGIAEALVTTALGIGVAIPAVWLFNFLTQRITRLLNEMECVAEELAVVALSNPQRDTGALPDTAGKRAAMAMRLGNSEELQAEINITPLVDVVLVLLVIFMVVTPRAEEPLPPHELVARVQAAFPEKRLTGLNLSADPQDAVRVGFASSENDQSGQDRPAGQRGGRRSEWHYIDSYTGVTLGEPRGQAFFRFTTELHRWLAMGDAGKAITGASTLALIVLCLSGLYLRWPRKMLDWRAWLTFNTTVKGRAFLWRLHTVTGTWVLLFYLLAGLTGLFWSYDWYRNGLYALTGASPPNRERILLDTPATSAPDIAAVWASFLRTTSGFSTANVTLPEKSTHALEIRYLDANPAHARAFNQLVLHPVSGAVLRHDRYAERTLGVKFMNSMFVLHSGSFFGLLVVVLMMVASLLMPLFAITGWQLYLARRAKKRATLFDVIGSGEWERTNG